MAIHPYPADVGASWTLPDGLVVRVRPIRPEDAEMEQSFVRHLSANSRHFRFMNGLKELTREMLVRFTQIDYDRELALLALVARDGVETEIAVARYTRSDASSAHLALVVADEWQGRGIGRRLLETIIEAARARGVTRLEAELLADNLPIQALLAQLGFTFHRDRDELDLLQAERTLAPST
jgi:acetyltransferase